MKTRKNNRDSIPYLLNTEKASFYPFSVTARLPYDEYGCLALAKNHLKMRSFRCFAFLRRRNRRLAVKVFARQTTEIVLNVR